MMGDVTMFRITLILLMCVTFLAATAMAADTCCPTDVAAKAVLTGGGDLPAGHPQLPAGHPQLPAGHPDVATSQPATTQPATVGVIAIRGIQGTDEGSDVTGDAVTVTLFSQSGPFKTIETKLDEHGVAIVDDVPLTEPVQPQVQIRHAGVTYETLGKAMDGRKPQQQVDVTVYETTNEKPDWKILMRHVILTKTEMGYIIKESLTIGNPDTRSWVGPVVEEGAAPPQIVTFTLPTGAVHAKPIRGLQECCTQFIDGKLISTSALNAGRSLYQYTYVLTPTNGKVTLDIVSPVDTASLIVFVPDDNSRVLAEDFRPMGTFNMHNMNARTFKAAGLKAGQKTVVTIDMDKVAAVAPVQDAAVKTAQGDVQPAVDKTPKVVAGVGVLGMVIASLIMLVFKPSKRR